MQPAAPLPEAHPLTLTLLTEPPDENVICARDTSSAPATQPFAPPITAPIAEVTEPCGGCSGIDPSFAPLPPAAGSGLSPVP